MRGIGGWLALFLFWVGIVGPLLQLGAAYSMFADPELAGEYGEAWPQVRNAELVLIAMLIAISWLICWRFLTVFNRATVTIGVVALWVYALLDAFADAALVSRITGAPFGELTRSWGVRHMAYAFIEALVWTLYLLFSKRVTNTYRRPQDVRLGETFQ